MIIADAGLPAAGAEPEVFPARTMTPQVVVLAGKTCGGAPAAGSPASAMVIACDLADQQLTRATEECY